MFKFLLLFLDIKRNLRSFNNSSTKPFHMGNILIEYLTIL